LFGLKQANQESKLTLKTLCKLNRVYYRETREGTQQQKSVREVRKAAAFNCVGGWGMLDVGLLDGRNSRISVGTPGLLWKRAKKSKIAIKSSMTNDTQSHK
jgi:hypothetical protein